MSWCIRVGSSSGWFAGFVDNGGAALRAQFVVDFGQDVDGDGYRVLVDVDCGVNGPAFATLDPPFEPEWAQVRDRAQLSEWFSGDEAEFREFLDELELVAMHELRRARALVVAAKFLARHERHHRHGGSERKA